MADETEKKPAFTAEQRKQYVTGLRNELELLKARPDSETKTRRVKEVEAQLSKYSNRPSTRQREQA